MNNKQPKDIIVLQHDELAFHPERYPEYVPEYFDNIDVCSLEYDLPSLRENNISFYPCGVLNTIISITLFVEYVNISL